MLDLHQSEIRNAWALRNAQQLDAAEQIWRKLSTLKKSDLGLCRELELLEASFLRARGQIEKSEELLNRLKSQIDDQGLDIPYQYYLQRGLNLFYQGYFSSALEFFTRCTILDASDELKIMALGNQVLCLDNLNLPSQKSIQSLYALGNTLSSDYFKRAVFPQLQTLECRQSFRKGDVKKVFAAVSPEVFSQDEYFRLWVSQLPYVGRKSSPEDLNALLSAPHFLWKNYRLRTLLVDSRFEEEPQVKVSERIDRLYLWLWKWMTSPETLPAELIEDSWAQLDPCEVCSLTTIEDFTLLRLCLRWTRLFDSRWEKPSSEWLKKSTPPHVKEEGVFQLESQVLDYLEAVKKKELPQAKKAQKN
jgi:hypothetical protein